MQIPFSLFTLCRGNPAVCLTGVTRMLVRDKRMLLPDKLIVSLLDQVNNLKFLKKYCKKKDFHPGMLNLGIFVRLGKLTEVIISYTFVKPDIQIAVIDPFYLFETIRNIDCHIALLFSTKKRTEAKGNDVFSPGQPISYQVMVFYRPLTR